MRKWESMDNYTSIYTG